MRKKLYRLLARLSWAQRFMLASLVVLILGMLGMGWWIEMQIEESVIHQSAANTALYVSSVVQPNIQELANGDSVAPEHQASLASLLQGTALGQHITAVKVWNTNGKVVYATDVADVGLVFPISDDLAHALRGWVASDLSNLDKPENINDRDRGLRRLETYSPIRRTGTDQIIGAVEFYQTVEALDRDIAAARQRSWLIVGATTLVMYLLLAGFVRAASDTIKRQRNELGDQVVRLQEVLAQNQELHERVRRAARRSTAVNERFLRRFSAELHDGPVQDLSYALLRLDHLLPAKHASHSLTEDPADQQQVQVVQSSLGHALQEIRAISAGMGLPELENLSLEKTIVRAVRTHEQRTNTQVTLTMNELPGNVPVPVKITAYRIIQEALSNAFRHANGASQQVQVDYENNQLTLIVSDRGPGFDKTREAEWDGHLGLVGMRERIESLGGIFQIESEVGRGTRVIARLFLDGNEGPHE